MSEPESSQVALLADIFASITRLAGTGICMYDLRRFFGEPYAALHKHYGGHRSAFCNYVREELENGYAACIRSDAKAAVMLASEYREPFLHTCHAGITEVVVPVLHRDEMIAVAFCGQCRLVGEARTEAVLAQLQPLGPDPDIIRATYEALPLLDRPTLTAAGKLLDVSLRYLVEASGRQLLRELAEREADDPLTQAERFIGEHYSEGITAGDVARHVHLSPAYLARLFRRNRGETITERIAQCRMDRARQLLLTTGIPARSIAVNVGYNSYVQFAAVFRRLTGESPSGYRKKRQVSPRRQSPSAGGSPS